MSVPPLWAHSRLIINKWSTAASEANTSCFLVVNPSVSSAASLPPGPVYLEASRAPPFFVACWTPACIKCQRRVLEHGQLAGQRSRKSCKFRRSHSPSGVRVQVNVFSLCENGSLEERRSFLDGQLGHKETIYATHSESANPPLHKSAYGATGLLKPAEVQPTNISGIHWHYYRERERDEYSDSPVATESAGKKSIKSVLFHHFYIYKETHRKMVSYHLTATQRIM